MSNVHEMKTSCLLVLSVWTNLLLAYTTIDPLITAADYKEMDGKIVHRLRTTKKKYWDDMVDDIVFYTNSLVNFHFSLEQNATGILEPAIELVDQGQPKFINGKLEDRVKENLELDEWDVYRFTTLLADAKEQWNKFEMFVNEVRANQTVLSEFEVTTQT